MKQLLILLGCIEESLNIVNQILLMFLIRSCKFNLDLKYLSIFTLLLISSISIHVLHGVEEIEGIFLLINLIIQYFVFMKVVEVNISKKNKILYFILTISVQSILILISELITIKIPDSKNTYGITDFMCALTTLLILLILSRWKIYKNKSNAIEKANTYMILNLTMGILTASFVIIIAYIFEEALTIQAYLVLIILSVLIIITVGIQYKNYLKKHVENETYKMKVASMNLLLDLEKKHLQDVVDSYKDLNKFRHDINGYLNSINSLIIDEKYQELLLLTNNLKQLINVNVLNKCNNIYIKATLNQFLVSMEDKEIEFTFDYQVLNEIKVKNHELCSLFYNLMSNAVEAAILCKEKKFINVSISNTSETLIIIISNSVNDVFKLDDVMIGKTNKDKMIHGIGLLNIQDIIESYNGNILREIENNKFITTIVLFEALEAL